MVAWWYFSNDTKNSCWPGRHDSNKGRFEDLLRLDSIQMKQFEARKSVHFDGIRSINAQIDSIKLIVRDEIFSNKPNEERLDSLFNEIAIRRTSIDTSIYYHFKRLKAICRPDQKRTFDSLSNEFFRKKDRKRR